MSEVLPTVSNTGLADGEDAVRRRRRWTVAEKKRMAQESYLPGMSVVLVARQYGIAPNQLYVWRRLFRQRALASGANPETMTRGVDYDSLRDRCQELQRLLGKLTLENELLRRTLELLEPENPLARAVLKFNL